MDKNKYIYRKIARIVVEATTPLAVGSGEKDVITDALVAKDVNGLPYIPGTSIAGVIRHALGYAPDEENDFYGYQKGKKNHGSEIMFSEARLVGQNGKAVDGMVPDVFNDSFLSKYEKLPVRQHVRINHKGAAADTGKFDEQVIYKGSRFCFDIEVVGESDDKTEFYKVLEVIHASDFSLGGGTRKGFGGLKVVSCKTMCLNLSNTEHWEKYKQYSSALDSDFEGEDYNPKGKCGKNLTTFTLELKPDDFFLFGSGFGDDDADMTPVKENYISWKNGPGEFQENGVLIPATSLKGAIAHRVAFYWNKENNKFADKIEDLDAFAAEENQAVKELFGSSGYGKKSKELIRGKVIFEDIIATPMAIERDKLLNHVSIDRFTGGAIDGALFTERSSYGKGHTYNTRLVVLGKVEENTLKALESALKDVCTGMLPLGGGVGRGNGVFTGRLWKNDILIYPKENV